MVTTYPTLYFIQDINAFVLNSANTKVTQIFRVPKNGTINQIGVQVFAITTSATVRVSLQTTTFSSGHSEPTGTYYGGSAQQTFTPTANTCTVVTLTTPASATMGDEVAVVAEWDSTVGNLNLGNVTLVPTGTWVYPQAGYFNGTSWAMANSDDNLTVFIGYSDGTYPDILTIPASSVSIQTFSVNTGSNPDELGVLLTMPFKCVVEGIWLANQESLTTPLDSVILYDVDRSTVLASVSMTQGFQAGAYAYLRFVELPAMVTLQQGMAYTLTLKSNSSSSASALLSAIFNNTAAASAVNAGSIPGVSRQNSGAWTSLPLTRYFMGLTVHQVLPWSGLGASYPY